LLASRTWLTRERQTVEKIMKYKPQDVERPTLKNCTYTGYPPGTFLAALTEYMIRFNAGGGWRRVYFSSDSSGRYSPSGTLKSHYYVKVDGDRRVEIELPEGFYELMESHRATIQKHET
jgi:hypothetical protein